MRNGTPPAHQRSAVNGKTQFGQPRGVHGRTGAGWEKQIRLDDEETGTCDGLIWLDSERSGWTVRETKTFIGVRPETCIRRETSKGCKLETCVRRGIGNQKCEASHETETVETMRR